MMGALLGRRLREPSTYAGLGVLFQLFGITIEPGAIDAAIALPEPASPPFRR